MARPRANAKPPVIPTTDAIERRVVALAEQLGRVVGTLQARADGWMDSPALNQQLTRIRDGASGLLSHLGGTWPKRSSRKTASGKKAKPATRSGGNVDAPGKAHRKA